MFLSPKKQQNNNTLSLNMGGIESTCTHWAYALYFKTNTSAARPGTAGRPKSDERNHTHVEGHQTATAVPEVYKHLC